MAVALSSNINWDEVIEKKARGIDDYDLGEVHRSSGKSVRYSEGHIR